MNTATQLVLLGAGFDMRAHRLEAAARATVFELDHPQTSSAKQTALRNAALPSRDVRYVGIDFASQSVAGVLSQAGFDTTPPTCFIWEGVTNYLTPEAINRALCQMRQTAARSTLIFTYIGRAVLENPARFYGAEKLMARLQSYGEPWTFGLRPEDLGTYLATRGFESVKNLSVAGVWQRAGRTGSGTRGYEFYWLASYSATRRPTLPPRRAAPPAVPDTARRPALQ